MVKILKSADTNEKKMKLQTKMPRSRMFRRIYNRRRGNGGPEEMIGLEANQPTSKSKDSVEGTAPPDPGEETEIQEESRLQPEIMNPQVDNSLQNNGENCFQLQTHQTVIDSVPSSNIPMKIDGASDLLMAVSVAAEVHKTKITEVALSAMGQLMRKALAGEPLWRYAIGNGIDIQDEDEYIRELRAFDASFKEIMRMIQMEDLHLSRNLVANNNATSGSQYKPILPGLTDVDVLQTEASRAIGFVIMSPMTLVELLMDVMQWSSTFANIVSKATTLGVLSTGVDGNYDGMLEVMKAEFHVPTPLVPVRECQFARYCKQVGTGAWAIVDVALDNLFPYPSIRFRRRPSGCLIQEMPNGQTKITWVEHVEVDNSLVHVHFQRLVTSGFAFDAKRWVATLIRHCEWVTTFMFGSGYRANGALLSQNEKKSLLGLAERMMRNFCVDISASSRNSWKALPVSDAEDFRVMNKTVSLVLGGTVETIAFSSSFRIPASPREVFNFLRREDSRNKWDALHSGHVSREFAHITRGDNPQNRISIIKVESSDRSEGMYLQESYADPTGYYVVYAPLDAEAAITILSGGDPDGMNILPSGFVIHPDRPATNGEETSGSILTIGFCSVHNTQKLGFSLQEDYELMHTILVDTAFYISVAVTDDG